MNNHVGYNQRLATFRNLALGTDGIGSDMFEELKFAFFKHRDAGGPLWPDSFARALSNGNELLSRNFNAQFGRVEAGYKADLTISDYASPTPFIAENIAGHIAFGWGAATCIASWSTGSWFTRTVSLPLTANRCLPKPERLRRRCGSEWMPWPDASGRKKNPVSAPGSFFCSKSTASTDWRWRRYAVFATPPAPQRSSP